VQSVASQVLRKTDLAFDYKHANGEFAVVMPGTSLEQGHIAGQKMAAALQQRLEFPVQCTVQIRALYQRVEEPQPHLLRDSVALAS
jgi:hypothetical protein